MQSDDSTASSPPSRATMSLEEMAVRLQALEAGLTGLKQLTETTTPMLMTLRSAVLALIATHPNPDTLLTVFHDQMDRIADAIPEDRLEPYREEAQWIQSVMLAASKPRQP